MKKALLTLFLMAGFSAEICFGQEIEWEKTIGGNGEDGLNIVRQTSDGGYILAGTSESGISGDKTDNSRGGSDYWVVKLDPSGNIQWQKTIGGNGLDYLQSIQQTFDGGYILGGYSGSDISGEKSELSRNGDYWVIKLNSTGNIEWENTIGGGGGEQLFSIQQTLDRGYILGGWSYSDITFDKTQNGKGYADYWVVKLDSLGNVQWDKGIGGSGWDYLRSIQQTSDKGYILGGFSESGKSGDKSENSLGFDDYWVVKLDSLGNIQWQNTIGGDGYDWLNTIRQTSDKGYILSGSSGSTISGDKSEDQMSADFWVVKLYPNGNIQWQNTIAAEGEEYPYGEIQQTTDGGYILGGWSYSNVSGDKTENRIGGPGIRDFWIIKLDSSGSIQWQNTIGGALDERFFSIQQTIDGGYITGGWSESETSGDKTQNCKGNFDYWVVKLTGKYNNMTGKLFADNNNNQIQDLDERGLTNGNVIEPSTGRFTFSNQDGMFNITVIDTGKHFISPENISYYNSIPAVHDGSFSGFQKTDSLNNFAFQPSGTFNDLCIVLSPMTFFRPGFKAMYMLSCKNEGTTTMNGKIIFYPDKYLRYISSDSMPLSVTLDSIVWNVTALAPFQIISIPVIVEVNALTPLGIWINSYARVMPVFGDANPDCNFAAFEVKTRGAFDPNNILVDRDTIPMSDIFNPLYLEYIINFQNTGTDTAFSVKIINPIDPNILDVSSMEYVASSHPVAIRYVNYEKNVEFQFDNILLPDSNINESGSHGYVRYKIKPRNTLISGDSIKNTAFIYFDFNLPVKTNTAVTEIVLPQNVIKLSYSSYFTAFPNPFNDQITFEVSGTGASVFTLTLYDALGRTAKKLDKITAKKFILDRSGMENGIYLFELRTEEKVIGRGKVMVK